MAETRVRIVGIGNPDRGDDAVGRVIVRQLQGRLPDGIEVVEAEGEATDLLDRLAGAEAAYLVDACVSSAEPGTIRRFDVSAIPLPQAAFSLSTHGLGLADTVELARALGQLPSRCVVYAIEGEAFEPGDPLSAAVAGAVPQVVERLCAEIARSVGSED